MSDNEKIYLESSRKNVRVTSSRVVLGAKNFVLRNISAVQVFSQKLKTIGIVVCLILVGCGIMMSAMFEAVVWFVGYTILGLLFLLMKDKHFVQVSSGGTPTNTIHSPTIEFPNQVVEAINDALLDLDKNRTSEKGTGDSGGSKSVAEELKELKGLLDAEIITQEEFDAKKKELLGL